MNVNHRLNGRVAQVDSGVAEGFAGGTINFCSWAHGADFVFADGSGVRFAANYKGVSLRDNVNGTDLLPYLCRNSVQNRQRIFLLGSSPEVVERTANNLTEMFPGLDVSGTQHGFFNKHDCAALIEKINRVNTDILLVALGSPIQEIWLQKNKSMLNVRTAIAVGGLFDFYSGRIPRAPLWMRKHGIEWIWRLMQEPVKKFKRYVIGNPLFLIRCITELKNREHYNA